MFRFENPFFLYALFIIPVLVGFYIIARIAREKAIERFGDRSLMGRLMPTASKYVHNLKFILLTLALFFLIIGWSNPQWGTKVEKAKRKSMDVIIALDVSQSMLSVDISPNRLDQAKLFINQLINGLKGEQLGFIMFAGNAYLQVPLTTDYSVMQLFAENASPSLVPNQGTSLGDAIQVAEQAFDEENEANKALIIITDGENHDDEAMAAARTAGRNGVLVYTVGVGTPAGSYIPVEAGPRMDYKRDELGNPILSKLNEQMLEDLSSAGNGQYFNLLGGGEQIVEYLRTQFSQMEKRELEQRVFTSFNSYFQYFLLAGLFLMVVEFLIAYQKQPFIRW